MTGPSGIEPRDNEMDAVWVDRADETNRYLVRFERHIWPIYQRHGYQNKALALIAFNLAPAADRRA
jgi:hypothetical protein